MYRIFAAAIALLFLTIPAHSQATGGTLCGVPKTLTAAVTTSNIQLSVNCSVAVVWNTGSNEVFVKFGTTNATVAAVTDDSIPAGSFKIYNVGLPGLWIAAITSTSTSTVRISTYQGAIAAGGGGGGGSSTNSGTSSSFGAAFPALGTASGFSDGTNMVAGRVTSGAMADNTIPPTSGILLGQAFNMVWDGTNWDRASGLTVGTAGTPSADVVTVQGAASMTPVVTTPSTQYPSGATPITASATGTTAATTATLAGTSAKTTYLCGFSIRANATAAVTGNATVTGTVTGTLNFTQFTAPVATGIGTVEQNMGGNCIPASATNTAIAVISAAPGTNGIVSVAAWGYQL